MGLRVLKKFQNMTSIISGSLYDIPNTVKSLQNILSYNHIYNTPCVRRFQNVKIMGNLKELNSNTNLIGVTMLTSFDDDSINEISMSDTVSKNVDNLSALAYDCGMDGIVCSPMEIRKVKEMFGSN